MEYKQDDIAKDDDTIDKIVNVIPFIVSTENIILSGNTQVYKLNVKRYFTFDIDITAYTFDELLDILDGKLSSSAMNLGKSLIGLTNATVNMNQMQATMTVELSEEKEVLRITGREFHMYGNIDLKAILLMEINIDYICHAIIYYDEESA